jgi:hypothetical protein
MEASGQLHAPVALPPGKSLRYPLDRRLDWPQSRSGRCGEEKNLAPVMIRTPDVQAIARHYTDWAIPTTWRIQIELTHVENAL